MDYAVEEDLGRIMQEKRERLESVKANIVTAQKRQKEQYDRKHSNPEVFAVGALVLKKDFTRKKRAGGKLDYRSIQDFLCTGKRSLQASRSSEPYKDCD